MDLKTGTQRSFAVTIQKNKIIVRITIKTSKKTFKKDKTLNCKGFPTI
jgi:hypothetical protein